MAIGFARPQIIGRSAGRSAVACAAYRAGEKLIDERTGQQHDYERKKGVLAQGVLLPKDAPEWMHDRAALWNAIERREDRSTRPDTAQLAREFVIALPHELDDQAREFLVKNFLKEGATRKGMIADYAIHAPDREGDQRNYHAHVMLTMRRIDPNDPDGFGNKAREWNKESELEAFKKTIERETNKMLKRHGIDEEITFVLEEGREAQKHMGEAATHLERRGIQTDRGDQNRAIEARNKERETLREDAERNARAFEAWQKEEDDREEALKEWGESLRTDENRDRAARWLDRINRRAEIRAGFDAAQDEATERQPNGQAETGQPEGQKEKESHGTTADLAAEYIRTAQNPVRDLRRWLDEDSPRRNGGDFLPSRPFASLGADSAVRPLRAEAQGDAPAPLDAPETTKDTPEPSPFAALPPNALERTTEAERRKETEQEAERQRKAKEEADRAAFLAEFDRKRAEAAERREKDKTRHRTRDR